MYRDGALAAPTSGTVTVHDAAGSALVGPVAVTVTASVATYSWTPASTVSLSEGCQVLWALAMPDGLTHTVREEAAIVRRRLYCPVTDADLFGVMSSLDSGNGSGKAITRLDTMQAKIDEAWIQIQLRLLAKGNRPNLIVSASALREVTMNLSLALIFGDLSTRLNESYADTARDYRAMYESAWGSVRLLYSEGDAETVDTSVRRSVARSVWLGTRGGV